MPGILYIVATPIGNLQDITLRALETLKSVDCIAAEDTRHSKRLLEHYSIATRVMSLHSYNEEAKFPQILTWLEEGKSIALISDAGTPLISDPGYHLVACAREQGIKVVPIPGACAAITALCVSGLPLNQFHFVGFLPTKSLTRQNRLQTLKDEKSTLVFYEAPHRIVELIEDVIQVFGPDRQVVIARELTKTFETIYSHQAQAVLAFLLADNKQQLGEFVVMIAGKSTLLEADQEKALKIYAILAAELPMKQAVKLAAEIAQVKKNALYDWVLAQLPS